jgi:hypothetical protein
VWGGRLLRLRHRARGLDLLSRHSRDGLLGTRRAGDPIPHDATGQQFGTRPASGRHRQYQRRDRPDRPDALHTDLRLLHPIRFRPHQICRIARSSIHFSFAHAPQRRCDCVANDESWLTISTLPGRVTVADKSSDDCHLEL